MATNKLQWKRIANGNKLPCQSFLRKKDGEVLKLSTLAGVKVGQDCYYLPVDEVINVIKDYPIEENKDEKIRKALWEMVQDTTGDSLWVDYNVHKEDAIAWLEKQGEQKPWSEEDEAIYYGVIETEQYMLDVVNGIKKFDVGNISIKEECTRELDWLKSLRPQSTWKPTEQQMKVLNEVINFAADHGTMRWNDYIYNVLKGLREQLKKL